MVHQMSSEILGRLGGDLCSNSLVIWLSQSYALSLQEVASLRDELGHLRRQAESDRRRALDAEAEREKIATAAREEKQTLEKAIHIAQVRLSP